MNAVRVHGEGEVLARISFNLGRLKQYGPSADKGSGMVTLSGGCGFCDSAGAGMYSSEDMVLSSLSSSSSSSSKRTEGAFNEDALDDGVAGNDVSEGKYGFFTVVTFGRNGLRRESRVAWPERDPENQPRPCRAGCGKHARLDDKAE
jgi:hypothetical protein